MRVEQDKPSSVELLELIKAKGVVSPTDLSKLEAVFNRPADDKPHYLRQILAELDAIPPGPLSSFAFRLEANHALVAQQKPQKLTTRVLRALGYAGAPEIFLFTASAFICLAGVFVLLAVLMKDIVFICVSLLLFITLAGVLVFEGRYTLSLSITTAKRLRACGLISLLAQGPEAILRIYDHTPAQWRLFLGPRTKTLRGIARLMIRHLPWYMNPTERYIPLHWLIWIFTALVTLLIPLISIGFHSTSAFTTYYIQYHRPPVWSTWLESLMVFMYLPPILGVLWQTSRFAVLKLELVRYLREQL